MEISRPTEAETEDDLIRLQEEFLKGNTKSSTILLRKDPPSVVTVSQ